jgi:hypothetical protein
MIKVSNNFVIHMHISTRTKLSASNTGWPISKTGHLEENDLLMLQAGCFDLPQK